MIAPCKQLESSISVINQVMRLTGNDYWLCFGGLWGLIMNQGTIPDGDLDICVVYGSDYRRIAKAFSSVPGGYSMGHAMLADDTGNAVHCGFGSSIGLPHICLSFWIEAQGMLWYGHDQAFEVKGEGIPQSGYYLKGIPKGAMRGTRLVEWPGINQMTKISVPKFPGAILDYLYPDWAYRKQRYEVKRNEVKPEKMVSYHKGGAISPFQVHVMSINDLYNKDTVEQQIVESQRKYEVELKNRC